ncbi:MAG: hypothetical protein ACYS6K_06880 [Planctomycetota bacterium]
MSLKNTKNLLIVAAVVVAVLAGTVLLGNYTNILSTGSQPKACQATKSATCTASQAFFADSAEGECTQKVECGSAEKTCPLDPSKPCCAVEGTPGCCPKTDCPADCDKPCCAGEVAPGCCPKSGEAAAETGCCPKSEATVAAKTGCCPGTITE